MTLLYVGLGTGRQVAFSSNVSFETKGHSQCWTPHLQNISFAMPFHCSHEYAPEEESSFLWGNLDATGVQVEYLFIYSITPRMGQVGLLFQVSGSLEDLAQPKGFRSPKRRGMGPNQQDSPYTRESLGHYSKSN